MPDVDFSRYGWSAPGQTALVLLDTPHTMRNATGHFGDTCRGHLLDGSVAEDDSIE